MKHSTNQGPNSPWRWLTNCFQSLANFVNHMIAKWFPTASGAAAVAPDNTVAESATVVVTADKPSTDVTIHPRFTQFAQHTADLARNSDQLAKRADSVNAQAERFRAPKNSGHPVRFRLFSRLTSTIAKGSKQDVIASNSGTASPSSSSDSIHSEGSPTANNPDQFQRNRLELQLRGQKLAGAAAKTAQMNDQANDFAAMAQQLNAQMAQDAQSPLGGLWASWTRKRP